jgi:hypothetical protein
MRNPAKIKTLNAAPQMRSTVPLNLEKLAIELCADLNAEVSNIIA